MLQPCTPQSIHSRRISALAIENTISYIWYLRSIHLVDVHGRLLCLLLWKRCIVIMCLIDTESSSSNDLPVAAHPNIVCEAARSQFLLDWYKQTLTTVLSEHICTQGMRPRQQTSMLRNWRQRMSASNSEEFLDASLREVPEGQHVDVRTYAAAWSTVSDGTVGPVLGWYCVLLPDIQALAWLSMQEKQSGSCLHTPGPKVGMF